MKKLALFDLDGTLFDTSLVNYCAYNEALNHFGYSIDQDYYCKECNGKDYQSFIPQIVNYDKIITEKVHNLKKELYVKYLEKAKINEALFDIIKNIKNDYYLAICTTASKKNALQILNFFNKKELFDLILTKEDIKNVKPSSEIFEKAMNHFNATPKNTMIFEDSELGIEAAIKTESTVFVIAKF